MNKPDTNLERERRVRELFEIGKAAVEEAKAESRRMGVPNVCSIDGQIYWELPNGELTTTDPGVWKVDAAENPPSA